MNKTEPTYLIVIGVSVISWIITHIVDRTLEKPILEYRVISVDSVKDLVSCEDNLKPKEVEVTRYIVKNLSINKLLEKVSLMVRADVGKIFSVRMRAVEPAVSADTPEKCYLTHAEFYNMKFHPGAAFLLDIQASTGAKLSLRLQESSTPINLTKTNYETCIVKYETEILLTIFIILSLLLLLHFFLKSEGSKKEDKEDA
ncbi:hypothetical protein [Pleionea sediminis]|uniref:hypothetical protein n=1 Tax=Pleionea sediminis TaxID=2569479 RepID=UPI0011851A44|nr:hypothetical protein [Pleionea sediminis]